MESPAINLLGQHLMLSFEGTEVPPALAERLGRQPVAGVTLFRSLNLEGPDQVRTLTVELQRAAPAEQPPLLIALDQEGGQFSAVGNGATPFPGNMALGATGEPELARQVGRALGLELAAMGVNVNYAPVCDLNTNPANPSVGIRAFGDEPEAAARMVAAMVEGMQAAGVAATLKHFPGAGEAGVDPHYSLPVLDHDQRRLESIELAPFRAGIEQGAKLTMIGHLAVPALMGGQPTAASVSREIIHDLLRSSCGFQGAVITDALDMGGIRQEGSLGDSVVRALRAGVDLLLLPPDSAIRQDIEQGFLRAVEAGSIETESLGAQAARVLALRHWAESQPKVTLDVIGSREHLALARQVSERALTLVRDDARLLPLRPGPDERWAVVMPRPTDLTPADTSSYVSPTLASSLRRYHPTVDEFITDHPPAAAEISDLRERIRDYDLALVGTINASTQPEQATLVSQLIATEVPLITIALRTPYDLVAYPESTTHICTYDLQAPSMEALAAAVWGEIPFRGRLPVAIPGLYPRGHRVG